MRSLALFLLFSTVAQAAPGNPDRWCRNGAFPQEGPDFKIAHAKSKVHFIGDDDKCPGEGKCEQKPYVIKGDELLVGRKYKTWICSAYVALKKKNKVTFTVGWLPLDQVDLHDVEAPTQDDWIGEWTDGFQSIKIKNVKGQLEVIGAALWDGGNGNVHVGSVEAKAKPEGDKLVLKEDPCEVVLRLIGKNLIATDNRYCGGMNVSFESVYLKTR